MIAQIISNAVVEADNEIGLEVIDSYQEDETPASDAAKPQAEEEVVKAPVTGETEAAGRFTSEDYSNYTPEEKSDHKTDVDEAEAAGIDEDKLYKE